MDRKNPKPEWLKVKIPGGDRYRTVKQAVRLGNLHTVCQEARCPNLGECWESGTATFMILGQSCTRGCEFCAVGRKQQCGTVDLEEPGRVAEAAAKMGLDYAVVTSVTRDDLEDGGASVFAETIRAIKALDTEPLVEVLIPDYSGDPLQTVLDAGPHVLAHNIEVVERLTAQLRHHKFSYERSLEVLRESKRRAPHVLTKSSIMLGLGEGEPEVLSAMQDLRDAGVDILVIGQYLQPTRENAPVHAYIPPASFDAFAAKGNAMGFGHVAAGPLVRTSYKAAESYVKQKAAPNAPLSGR